MAYKLIWLSATGTLLFFSGVLTAVVPSDQAGRGGSHLRRDDLPVRLPRNLAIGTAAARQVGMEGVLSRRVFGWSVLFLLVMCLLVFLRSTPVLGWMRVGG